MPHAAVRRLAAALALIAACLLAPGAALAKQGPVIGTFSLALPFSWAHPDLDPRGANDFACRPSAAHPRPVVLLHGTYANRFNSFAAMAPAIRRQGFCVFAPDYGLGRIRGLNGSRALRSSSTQVAAFVDRVLAATGARQVDLVGYSQGALVGRAYLRYDGGTDPADPAQNKVHGLVGLSAINHGTRLGGLADLLDRLSLRPVLASVVGESSADVLVGSPFLAALNAGAETEPGVRYAMLATGTDEINVPASRAMLTAGPGAQVDNILLQRGCSTDLSDHFNITYSPRAIALTLHALDPDSPVRIPCGLTLPGF